MLTDRCFSAKLAAIAATALLCGRLALCDETPKTRTSLKTCEIRRASTILNLGTMLKQGDYTGAKFLLLGLPQAFADCHGVMAVKTSSEPDSTGTGTIAAFSKRLVNLALQDWSPNLAVAELDVVRFKAHAQAHPQRDQRCEYRVAESRKSFELWLQTASMARALQASLESAKKEQTRMQQKELTDQLFEAMERNDKAANTYRLQVRACFNACAPLEPPDCHPDTNTPRKSPS